MESICGAECATCGYGQNLNCKGCQKTNGCPFGKQCFIAKMILTSGKDSFEAFKQKLMEEVNSYHIPDMPDVTDLNPLNGDFVNITYPFSNGKSVQLLCDDEIYLGTQIAYKEGEEERFFGLVANNDFWLVCKYGLNGSNPELIFYKKR